jgi:hypothetical protein
MYDPTGVFDRIFDPGPRRPKPKRKRKEGKE